MYSRAAGEPESGGGLRVEEEGLRRGNDEKKQEPPPPPFLHLYLQARKAAKK